MAASYWFQIWKIHVHKEVRDLSVKYHILLAIGFGILIFTALHEDSTIFLVKQITTFIPVIIIICQIKYYRKHHWCDKESKFCDQCSLKIESSWKYCPYCGMCNHYCFRENYMMPSLYCITDKDLSPNRNVLKDIKEMCEGGCKIIQLREKNLNYDEYLDLAKQAKEITRKYQAKLIINDSIEVARDARADGVHLGQNDKSIKYACKLLPKNTIIGISAHSLEEFYEAKKQHPTYIAIGSIFPTQTKKDVKIVGIDLLKEICDQKKDIPIVAIGGINRTNVKQVLAQGADSVAIISEVLKSENIKIAVQDLIRESKCRVKCRFKNRIYNIIQWLKK